MTKVGLLAFSGVLAMTMSAAVLQTAAYADGTAGCGLRDGGCDASATGLIGGSGGNSGGGTHTTGTTTHSTGYTGGRGGPSSDGGRSSTARQASALASKLASEEASAAAQQQQLTLLRSQQQAYNTCAQASASTGTPFNCGYEPPAPATIIDALPKNATPAQKAAAVKAVAAVPAVTPQQAAWIAVAAHLKIPTIAPGFGPAPSINKWHIAVVGYPYWLWADGATQAQAAAAVQGLQVRLDASVASMTYNMGDGGTITCSNTGTPWRRGATPGAVSPTCGYRYAAPSLPKGDYTVTATAHWSVKWKAGGQAGVINLDRRSSMQVPVGELQAVVVSGGQGR